MDVLRDWCGPVEKRAILTTACPRVNEANLKGELVPLETIQLEVSDIPLSPDATHLLRVAERRIEEYFRNRRVPGGGFIPSDFETIGKALATIVESHLMTGSSFCEWGSGFGVITLLAALLDLDACGIEAQAELVEGARQLADDLELPAEFVAGSFLPYGWEEETIESSSDFTWLDTTAGDAYEELGLSIADFDLIFVFPWPDEEEMMEILFDEHAAEGALLLINSTSDSLRLLRKV